MIPKPDPKPKVLGNQLVALVLCKVFDRLTPESFALLGGSLRPEAYTPNPKQRLKVQDSGSRV